MLTPVILFTGGVMLLVKGAAWLVDGSASIARRFGIAPIVIGLTIVAFGTSAPELVVNLVAAINGKTDIAIGNVVGSNIANILLVLGLAALIRPIILKRNTVWKEIPIALLAVVLVWTLANDRLMTGGFRDTLDRIDGIVLLAFFGAFLYYTVSISKGEKQTDGIEVHPLGKSFAYAVAGLFGLVIGGKLAVDGAVGIAYWIGLSERVIGLTVVAVGTSLPELMTSAVASYRKQSDIAVGNVIGSNIFNIFWILGLSTTIRPLPFSSENSHDVVIAGLATLMLFIAAFVGKKFIIERWQGAAIVALYGGYVALVVTK